MNQSGPGGLDPKERWYPACKWRFTASECNYSHIEEEALSIVFGVKKFHLHLYGRQITFTTDQKPLVTILGPKTGDPTLAAT